MLTSDTLNDRLLRRKIYRSTLALPSQRHWAVTTTNNAKGLRALSPGTRRLATSPNTHSPFGYDRPPTASVGRVVSLPTPTIHRAPCLANHRLSPGFSAAVQTDWQTDIPAKPRLGLVGWGWFLSDGECMHWRRRRRRRCRRAIRTSKPPRCNSGSIVWHAKLR